MPRATPPLLPRRTHQARVRALDHEAPGIPLLALILIPQCTDVFFRSSPRPFCHFRISKIEAGTCRVRRHTIHAAVELTAAAPLFVDFGEDLACGRGAAAGFFDARFPGATEGAVLTVAAVIDQGDG